MKNGEQPAFADPMRAAEQSIINQSPSQLPTGLTKRELIAAMAMQGLLSSFTVKASIGNWMSETDTVAKYSIELADELLKQLEAK